MDVRIKSLKILSDTINNIEEIESSILNIKGVVDAKINPIGTEFKLDYALDDWASDHDVMVSIMELLENDFSLESEPYFDEDEDIVVESKEEHERYHDDYDEHDHEDVSDGCEDHAPEALRYAVMSRHPRSSEPERQGTPAYDPFAPPRSRSEGFTSL